MDKSWYLLRYHYGQASRAIANLERLGVHCFSPRVKKHSSTKAKVKCKDGEHLFPPYIFVEFNPEEIQFSSVQYTPGVYGFVRFGHTLKQVPERVVNMLLISESVDVVDVNNGTKTFFDLIQHRDKQQRSVMFLALMEDIITGRFVTTV